MNERNTNALPEHSNSSASTSTRYYQLRRGCCVELNVVLCLRHLSLRIHDGWKLGADRGVDGQGCYDCQSRILLE
jgi:hypothetical protein